MQHRRRWASVIIGVAALATLLLVLVPTASSQGGPDEYTASISPATAGAGSSDTFTLRITNSGTSGTLGSANIDIPSGFTGASLVSGTLAGSGGESWAATIDSGTIELRASSSSDALATGDHVEAQVNATAPTATGPYTWTTAAEESTTFSGAGPFTLEPPGSYPVVDVAPGPLDHFTWTSSPGASQTAGVGFSATVEARDQYDNVVTDYDPSGADFSGLGTSPHGDAPTYGFTWDHGVATSTAVTDYLAETAKLTVRDGSVSADSDSFTVAPGALASFEWTSEPGSSQTAGSPFGAAVTAYDTYGNVKTDYDGSTAGFSGLGTSPHGDAPVYGFSWSVGVGSSSTVTDYKAEAAKLTVTDGSVSADSDSVTVAPAPLAAFDWTTEPGGTQTAGAGFGAVVTAEDAYGNVKTNYDPSGARFTGLGTSPHGDAPTYGFSWSSGVATSSTVTDYKAETTKLTVTDRTVTADSSSFTVAPAALASFTWAPQPGGTQTAGVAFSATVTAYDVYGNLKTNYGGGAVFSGLHDSPNGDHPAYGFSWSSGVATSSTVTDYKAETTKLTVTDSTVTADSSSFTVAPAALASFTWAPQPGGTQTAGVAFSATVTAYDAYGNVKTNYDPSGVQFSGLGTSPHGDAPVYGFSWSSGVASSSTVTDYKAETTKLTVTDGTITKDSAGFTVVPAALGSFAWTGQPASPQTAGVGFPATVTSYDIYGNVKTNYSGTTATISGLGTSAKGCLGDHTTVSAGAPNGCNPKYGFTWSSGVATSSAITDYKAETAGLTVTDGSITKTSSSVTVNPNVPYRLSFAPQDGGLQPTDTACSVTSVCPTTSPPTNVIMANVYDEDAFGNPEIGVNVKISIGTNPGAGSLTGTTVKATGPGGVATFGTAENLQIDQLGVGYTLLAQSPDTGATASATSTPFNIANAVTPCSGSCTTSAVDKFDNITATASGVNGKLSITMVNQTGACSAITNQVGNLDTVNPTNPSGSPTLEVSGTLLHRSNKGGIGNAVICKNSGPGTPFHSVPMCNKVNDVAPCLRKLSGQGQGDVFFDLIVKATQNPDGTWAFDPTLTGGGR